MALKDAREKAAKRAIDKDKKNWLQRADKEMERKGTKGEFTRKAKAAGYDNVQEYARHVLANKGDYDKETIRQAQFAANMGKIAKEDKE